MELIRRPQLFLRSPADIFYLKLPFRINLDFFFSNFLNYIPSPNLLTRMCVTNPVSLQIVAVPYPPDTINSTYIRCVASAEYQLWLPRTVGSHTRVRYADRLPGKQPSSVARVTCTKCCAV